MTQKRYCENCKKEVVSIGGRNINHILHIILSIITGGLWLLVYLFICMTAPVIWRCPVCGGSTIHKLYKQFKNVLS